MEGIIHRMKGQDKKVPETGALRYGRVVIKPCERNQHLLKNEVNSYKE